MHVTIPVYVEHYREESPARMVYRCEPLFFPIMNGRDEHLPRAMGKLMKRLKPQIDALAAEARHDRLAQFLFNPPCTTRILKLSLRLRDRVAKTRLLFVTMDTLDRRVVFTPSVPDTWFDVGPSQDLLERSEEVLSSHFREQAKLNRRSREAVKVPSLSGQAWVSTLDVDVASAQVTRKAMQEKLASLFDDSKLHGATELRRVGRCLDWLYPDDLKRAILREREVAELTRLLDGRDRRPVLLVGPSLVGKTTVLHEFVHRRVSKRKRPYNARRNTWLLSPQRLISGMSYVGQWENRVLAILQEAHRRDHVLYFNDLLGLYQAGISAESKLCVADVLRSHVLRREVRVVGELTPEVLAAFQERDRGFADQFHVIPIRPTGEDDTLRILLQVRRELEAAHHCRFDPQAVPTVLELTRRYQRDAAFPGKAAGFLQHVATKRPRAAITRESVNEEFQTKTGLSRALLDNQYRISRTHATIRFEQSIVGQKEAVNAATDIVMVAKAGLNDPVRPLATMLFLGPTGVGKTECAKALAKVLFSDESRLLRFDMNEFVSPYSASRLAGTIDEPEGLLTSAVRRQPYSVVLLDEIEKAHPDVFDLLLQVTGEGRLTDALGRTSDFTNCVVVMTSNLGVRESGRSIGLQGDEATRRQTFMKAAEQFFRPEFFNRIDRVVPFSQLSRDEMQRIAELLLRSLFQREGLVRRQCALHVDERAMEQIVDEGYHPQLGARALKRSLEKQLTQPIAEHLTRATATAPTVIRVYRGPTSILADVHPLERTEPIPVDRTQTASDLASQSKHLAERLTSQLESTRPAQAIGAGDLDAEQLRYFAIKEQIHVVRELASDLGEQLKVAGRSAIRPEFGTSVRDHSHRTVKMLGWSHHFSSPKRLLQENQAADDINDFVRESAADVTTALHEIEQKYRALRHETAWLWAMWKAQDKPERVLVTLRSLTPQDQSSGARLMMQYAALFRDRLSFDWQPANSEQPGLLAFTLAGPCIWPLVARERGIHLFRREHENLIPVQMSVVPVNGDDDAACFAKHLDEYETWRNKLALGEATLGENPVRIGKVIRVYEQDGSVTDFASLMTRESWFNLEEWRSLIFAGLEPPKLEELP